MMSTAYAKFPMVWLTCIGLLIFMGVFIGAIFWANRRGSREFYQRLSALPLEEDEEVNHG